MSHSLRHAGTNIVLVKNDRILLARRRNTGWAYGLLGLPGGHLNTGETARQAAARELNEELGLNIALDRLVFFSTVLLRTNHDNINQEFYADL